MFPRINAQKRHKLSHHRILVRIGPHADPSRLLILDQPRPATALNTRQFRVHHFLQLLQPAVRLLDLFPQCAAGRLSAALVLGRQVLPEQAVVNVPPAVEIDQWLQGDLLLDVGGGGGGEGGELLGEIVEAVHVGGVVLGVVQLHDLPGDGGFEGGVVVWRGWC